ncbi:peptidylprolyl isomerase [Sphingomonas sp. CGMCC 1.13654]|uniref:peptidylprolyl isomerase n=1 Tax=Sphingomonas chungangi TaxID=2683589 RepID=A0A838L4B8_9SPHN|nr:peptidylprolyl isomerase [Sphingomonas chungangi]MBA2933877.1 peptidylprolyl isomerase [Sphingomonas chungangi]MVW55207.1 peptidylprolyl isomerase [Sphingomonas chungangi]
MRRYALLPLFALLAAAAPPVAKSPGEIVAAAPASAWRAVDPDNLLLMDLGNDGHVAIELTPAFAPAHVANIRALVRGHWFDGNAIVRVQDNYVVQWGGADEKKPLPVGVAAHLPAEYERPRTGLAIRALGSRDVYAPEVGHADGWPVASDGKSAWLPHCYGMVGVGRDMPPDTGTGAELYTVIGQAPRHLDRNITVVGRIVDGIEAMTALPRGTGDLGFYSDPTQRLAITRARIASDVPEAERPRYQVMRSDAPAFAAYVDARANRRDAFFVRPAGAVDICNAPVPTRRAP